MFWFIPNLSLKFYCLIDYIYPSYSIFTRKLPPLYCARKWWNVITYSSWSWCPFYLVMFCHEKVIVGSNFSCYDDRSWFLYPLQKSSRKEEKKIKLPESPSGGSFPGPWPSLLIFAHNCPLPLTVWNGVFLIPTKNAQKKLSKENGIWEFIYQSYDLHFHELKQPNLYDIYIYIAKSIFHLPKAI